MTKIKTFTAAGLLAIMAASAHGIESYNAFAAGSPDIRGFGIPAPVPMTTRSSVSSGFDRYHGLADGNPDLFGYTLTEPGRPHARTMNPDIYGPFGGSSDLSY